MTRLFLGLESLATGNSGIGRLAWLIARVVGEETCAGLLRVGGSVLRDAAPPRVPPVPVAVARKSRLRFVGAVARAGFTHTHFLYDFLGMARAHGWVPGGRRPYLTTVCGVEAWPGRWGRPDRVR